MIGGAKVGEYWRTVDMLKGMTGKSYKDIMYILYFLADSQYGNDDLRKMAKLIEDSLKNRGCSV